MMTAQHRALLACATLTQVLLHRAEVSSDKRAYAFLDDGETIGDSLTYAQCAQRALALAASLQRRYEPGDRLLLLYPACIDYMVAFFACQLAGMIAVPLFPPRGAKRSTRLEAIAADCKPRAALISSRRLSLLRASLEASPGLAVLETFCTDHIETADATLWSAPNIDGDTIAFLQYTSGSTGLPKGVMVTHANLLANERQLQASFESDENTTTVTWLPIYHDMGLIGNMLQSFWLGGECVFMAPVAFLQRPMRWLQAVSDYRARVSGGPNFAYDFCVDKISETQRQQLDLSPWTVAFNGAEPVRRSTLERFANTFASCGFRRRTFYPCYGMAEATLIVSGGAVAAEPTYSWIDKTELTRRRIVAQAPELAQSVVSCGVSMPEQIIRVVDEATCEQCEPGVVGEIWLAGPNIARGYWERSEVNAATFGARIVGSNEGPFLRTGDLGFLDGDELYITGRMKDVIIVRGANYFPQDIEAVAEAAHAAINPAGVAAFGIAAESGEKVVVVAEIARTSLRRMNASEIQARIRQRVMEECEVVVDIVVFIRPGTLPKSSSGKVQRNHCRTLYASNELQLANSESEIGAVA